MPRQLRQSVNVAKLEKENAKLEKEREKLEKDRAKLEKDRAKAEKETAKLEKERAKAEKEAAKLEKENAKAEKERSKLEKENAKLEKANAKAEKERTKSEKANAKAAKEASKLEKTRAKLEKNAKTTKTAKTAKTAKNSAIPDPSTKKFQDYINNLLSLSPKEVEKDYPFIKVPHRIEGATIKEHLEKISSPDEKIDACGSIGKMEIQPHQSIIYAMANLRANHMIQTPGLLAVHSTGAGKTLAALITFLAFWHCRNPDTNQLWPLFFISTKGNQDSNSLNKLAELGIKFFPKFVDATGPEPVKPFDVSHVSALADRVKQLKDEGKHPSMDPVCQEWAVKHFRERLLRGMESIYKADYMEEIRNRSRDNLLTFGKLANDVEAQVFKTDAKGQIENALFVIDEVQFLMAPPESEKHLASQYNALRVFLQNGRNPANTWILAMSATPGETRDQVSGILNIVAGVPKLFSAEDFDTPETVVAKARGIVSYANLIGDFSHFAKLALTPQCVVLDSESSYYRRYMKVVDKFFQDKERLEREGEYLPEAKHRFYAKLREAGNFITKSMNVKKSDEEDEDDDDGGDDGDGDVSINSEVVVETKDGRGEYKMYVGPKLIQVLANIKRLKGKHFIYSSSTTTILLLAHLLEKYCDMKPLPVDCKAIEAKENDKNEEEKSEEKHGNRMECDVDASAKDDSKQKYFVLLDNLSTKKEHLREFGFPNAPTSRVDVNKAWTNRKENYNGSRVQVILATKENFKGVDMNHLRWLHLVDPLVDFQDFIQFMGRGPRFCSHSKYPIAKRMVDVLLYRNVLGNGCPKSEKAAAQLADCHVFNNSLQRYHENWAIIEQCLQQASVDYKVFNDNIHRNIAELKRQLGDLKCAVLESPDAIVKRMGKEFEREQKAAQEAAAAVAAKEHEARAKERAKQNMTRADRAALRSAMKR